MAGLCERCNKAEESVAGYLLEKAGGTRRVELCAPCRDVTALVHRLDAVEGEPVPDQSAETEGPVPEEGSEEGPPSDESDEGPEETPPAVAPASAPAPRPRRSSRSRKKG